MEGDAEGLSRCGESCHDCSYFVGDKKPSCPGCGESGGRPFWGECRIYSCTESHQIAHCGVCDEFPCDGFVNHFDPNNSEGQRNALLRAGILAYRAKQGEQKAAELAAKVARQVRKG